MQLYLQFQHLNYLHYYDTNIYAYNILAYGTLSKITQFWLVESSTINPKLYSYLLSFHGNNIILLNVL